MKKEIKEYQDFTEETEKRSLDRLLSRKFCHQEAPEG